MHLRTPFVLVVVSFRLGSKSSRKTIEAGADHLQILCEVSPA
jgi:hypothetical protein